MFSCGVVERVSRLLSDTGNLSLLVYLLVVQRLISTIQAISSKNDWNGTLKKHVKTCKYNNRCWLPQWDAIRSSLHLCDASSRAKIRRVSARVITVPTHMHTDAAVFVTQPFET